ncbi:ATP-binding cassette domain-containing protein [Nocardioides sp. HDW12B]|uniref:ABC transporter ATP-binding protein n=1 Tax=Nocardioides sp. HDW12B TaxID=2714939 RepID=UPI001407A086|nr:ATP-binding cassette domain-containing protein [Nocardioides sp. HDW12B]QIK65534.1 ATP-binding cassette domain-containing protein [Nocardioides sp. HDW12B]
MIRTHSLTKRYGELVAVDGLDLDVREGDVYGFLGANGSGKTTTVRMLLGLVLATSGEIELLDRPMPRAARDVLPQVGCLVEGPAAYPHLSGRANLALLDAAGPRGPGGRRGRRARVGEVLDQVGLARAADRRVRGYSLGMRQRLGLAAALLQRPRLLVLDEPTNGLDPQGIREMRDLLLALNATGTTVFLSSHLLAEVEQLCRRVGVLDRGRMVLQEDLADLQAPTGRVVVTTSRPADAVRVLDGRVVDRVGTRLVVRAEAAAEVNAALVAAGVPVDELGPERRGLEQVVLEATEGTGDVR